MSLAREFRRKLDNKEQLLGFLQFLPSPQVTEMAGFAGFDWLWLCQEHGTIGFGTELESCIRAAEVSGMLPMVRIIDPTADWMYMRALEAGAKGIIVPRVRNANEVQNAVNQVKYPPQGSHGLCQLARRWRYGVDAGDLPYGYTDNANDETFVSVLIEQKEAMDNIDEILSVEGLDFVIWGPLDMMMAMGYMQKGEKEYSEGLKVMADMRQNLIEACASHGVTFEEHYGDKNRAQELMNEGLHIMHTTPDTVLFMDCLKNMNVPIREINKSSSEKAA